MLYLAMTAAEMERCQDLPPHVAWMACRFSSHDQGLTNRPRTLPSHSVIIVDDQIPIADHDPVTVEQQLQELIEKFNVSAVLLDFQRSGGQEMAAHLVNALPVPTGISEQYAKDLDCPVFLSPRPLCRSLSAIAEDWKGRELWQDAPVASQAVTVTEKGATLSEFLPYSLPQNAHFHQLLQVHYTTRRHEDRVEFTLFRGPQELKALSEDGEKIGFSRFFCLFQEFSEKST